MSFQNPYFAPSIARSSLTSGYGPNLGQKHIDQLGRVWIYGQANGAFDAGDVGQMSEDGTYDFTPMTTSTLNSIARQLGVPDIALTDNQYAWFFIGGIGTVDFEIICANGLSANSILTSTATAGELGSGGTPIDGARNIDAGVTNTRVTVKVFGNLTAGVTAAYD